MAERPLHDGSSTLRVITCASADDSRLRATVTVHFHGARAYSEQEEATETIVASLIEVLGELPTAACIGNEATIVRRVLRQVLPLGVVRRVDLSIETVLSGSGPRRSPVSKTGERGRVLVVDDDAVQRATLEGLLSEEFEVSSASSAKQAERLLALNRYDVVLSDHDMPDGSGVELLHQLDTGYPGVIGMLVTGHDEYPEVIAAKRDRRVFRVLLKPYDPQMLVATVRSAVTLARMRGSTTGRITRRTL